MCILFHWVNKPEHLKLDCFRLLAELHRAGVNNTEAARRLGKPRATVQHWKEGAEPCYTDGKRLIDLHAYVTAALSEKITTSA
jgi:hypothetical protein